MATVSRVIPTTKDPDIVSFTIKVDGAEIPKEILVTRISISREINKIPVTRIYISDGDLAKETFEISDGELFLPGKKIEVSLGYSLDNKLLFKGIIITHAGKFINKKPELMIECRDEAVKMTIGKKFKHFNDVKDSDIAEELIGLYSGLSKDVEATTITHKDIVQYNLSDWDFILSRMDSIGNICLVQDGRITLKKPDLSGTTVLDVLFGATIIEHQVEIDARHQFKVKSHSWDYSGQEVKEGEGAEPAIAKEPGNLPAADLEAVIGIDNYNLVYAGKLADEELQAWASAKLQKQRLAKIRGWVKFMGFPDVLPGTFISLNGVGARFNGAVFVNGVNHEFKDGDWETEVHFGIKPEWFAESVSPGHPGAALGMMPALQGLMYGVVTDIEDPEGEHRVKVKLPVISSEEEGIWARIATLDAGKERGTFFRPELDDEVVVGFVGNDPRQMVILGMLHSSALAAPLTAAKDNDEKGYVSREKMKFIFNDKEKSIKIETPAGKKVTISEQDKLIKIEDEDGNKITMEKAGITIESAKALTLKGGSEVKIEAPSISVNGSSTTEIKGGMVKIN
jgi:Rhs element Vgr protein